MGECNRIQHRRSLLHSFSSYWVHSYNFREARLVSQPDRKALPGTAASFHWVTFLSCEAHKKQEADSTGLGAYALT